MALSIKCLLGVQTYVRFPDACHRGTGIPGTLFSLRGLYLYSFAFSSTVPTCLDGTRGGRALRLPRGLVRSASAQKYAISSERRPAGRFQNMKRSFPKARGIADTMRDHYFRHWIDRAWRVTHVQKVVLVHIYLGFFINFYFLNHHFIFQPKGRS